MSIVNPSMNVAQFRDPYTNEPITDPEKQKLKSTCHEFEAVMTSLIMKEGLKSAQEIGAMSGESGDEDRGSEMYKEIANEQIAHFIGKQGLMGLANMIYKNVEHRLDLRKTEVPNESKLNSIPKD